MGFLELRQEPGIYSRVTAGMAIRNSTLFSEIRTPVSVNLCSFPKEVKPLVLYDVEHQIAMEPMKG